MVSYLQLRDDAIYDLAAGSSSLAVAPAFVSILQLKMQAPS